MICAINDWLIDWMLLNTNFSNISAIYCDLINTENRYYTLKYCQWIFVVLLCIITSIKLLSDFNYKKNVWIWKVFCYRSYSKNRWKTKNLPSHRFFSSVCCIESCNQLICKLQHWRNKVLNKDNMIKTRDTNQVKKSIYSN